MGGEEVALRVVGVDDAGAVGAFDGRNPACGVAEEAQPVARGVGDAAAAVVEVLAAGQNFLLHAAGGAEVVNGAVRRGQRVLRPVGRAASGVVGAGRLRVVEAVAAARQHGAG